MGDGREPIRDRNEEGERTKFKERERERGNRFLEREGDLGERQMEMQKERVQDKRYTDVLPQDIFRFFIHVT